MNNRYSVTAMKLQNDDSAHSVNQQGSATVANKHCFGDEKACHSFLKFVFAFLAFKDLPGRLTYDGRNSKYHLAVFFALVVGLFFALFFLTCRLRKTHTKCWNEPRKACMKLRSGIIMSRQTCHLAQYATVCSHWLFWFYGL